MMLSCVLERIARMEQTLRELNTRLANISCGGSGYGANYNNSEPHYDECAAATDVHDVIG
jgi:hypothetical protein